MSPQKGGRVGHRCEARLGDRSTGAGCRGCFWNQNFLVSSKEWGYTGMVDAIQTIYRVEGAGRL